MEKLGRMRRTKFCPRKRAGQSGNKNDKNDEEISVKREYGFIKTKYAPAFNSLLYFVYRENQLLNEFIYTPACIASAIKLQSESSERDK